MAVHDNIGSIHGVGIVIDHIWNHDSKNSQKVVYGRDISYEFTGVWHLGVLLYIIIIIIIIIEAKK